MTRFALWGGVAGLAMGIASFFAIFRLSGSGVIGPAEATILLMVELIVFGISGILAGVFLGVAIGALTRPKATTAQPVAGPQLPRKRPGLLTAICVLAIVLGAMGIAGTAAQLALMYVVTAWMPSLEASPEQTDAQSDPLLSAQHQRQTELEDIMNRWQTPAWVLRVWNFLVSVGLLVGGILALGLRPIGRAVLIGSFLFGVAYVPVACIPMVAMNVEMSKIYRQDLMPPVEAQNIEEAILNAQQDSPDQSTATVLVYISVLSLVWAIGMMLVWALFYIGGAVYLCRPSTRELFAPPSAMEPPLERFS